MVAGLPCSGTGRLAWRALAQAGPSGVAFSLFFPVMPTELWTYFFGDEHVGSADVFDSAMAFIDERSVESFSRHGGGLFEGGLQGGAVVEVLFEADKEMITPLSRSIATEVLRPNLLAAGRQSPRHQNQSAKRALSA